MKLALCLSGHMRSFAFTFPKLKENLLKKFDTDIFIHTWETLGSPISKNNTDSKFKHLKTENSISIINQLYKPKKIFVENFLKDKVEQETEHLNKLVSSLERPHISGHISHHLSMWYSIKKANDLKNEYSKSTGVEYDLVCRFRPDGLLETPLHPNLFTKSDSLHIPIVGQYLNNGMNDQFAIGNNQIMDWYSSIYDYLPGYFLQNKCGLRPEPSLYYHINQANISIITHPIQINLWRMDGKILVQNRMDAYWK